MLLCIQYNVTKLPTHTDISYMKAIANLAEADLRDEIQGNDLFLELADSVTSNCDVGEYLVILLIDRTIYNSAQNMMSYNLIHFEVQNISLTPSFTGILRC